MSRDPLRVLILLPLVLASIYIPVGLVGTAYADVPGDASISAPNIISHSVGPAPTPYLPAPASSLTASIEIRVADVGPIPEDADGWNAAGKLDPAFFRILSVRDGPVLDDECTAAGGSTLFASSVDLRSGEWAASELCLAGPPQPDDIGFVGGGVLLTILVRVTPPTVGCSSIDLFEDDTFLRDIDGFDSVPIPAMVSDGSFCNTPEFNADFQGTSATLSPHKLSLGGSVTLHSTVQSNGPVTVAVVWEIMRPDAGIDIVVQGPVSTLGGGTNLGHVDYLPPLAGFYTASATSYWSEDGGMTYLYAGSAETHARDFTVSM